MNMNESLITFETFAKSAKVKATYLNVSVEVNLFTDINLNKLMAIIKLKKYFS